MKQLALHTWKSVLIGVLLLPVWAYSQSSLLNYNNAGDLITLVSETTSAPIIVSQPQIQIVIPGHSCSFSVGIFDTLGVSYQWFFNDSPISSATNDSLAVINVSTNNEGAYSVVVSNPSGSVPSSPANLYIDSDADGLPDSWESAHFGGLNQTGTGDTDQDGVLNLQEFFDGTNPTNSSSVLYRVNIVNDGGSISISPNQATFTKGQVVTVTASSSNNPPFHAWTGDITSRSNALTLVVNSNINIFAHFQTLNLAWTNSASGDWNVASNWNPNLVPLANESVAIQVQVTVTENSNIDLLNLTLGSASGGTTLNGTGRITISGLGTWLSGSMLGGGTGSTVVLPGAVLQINNPFLVNLNNRTLENAGTIIASGGNIGVAGASITNDEGGQFLVQNAVPFILTGGTARFDNAGTFVTDTAGTVLFTGIPFNNYGTLDLQAGNFSMGGGGFESGLMKVAAGATLTFNGGNFSSDGNLTIAGPGSLSFNGSGAIATLAGSINVSGINSFTGGNVDFTGNYICTNNLVISNATVSFDGTGNVSPMNFTQAGFSTLGGAQNVTVQSAMTWAGGTMTGNGRTLIGPAATLLINSPTLMNLNSRTLDNAGTTSWTAGSINMSGGVITNETGALFLIQSPESIFASGTAHFDNSGTLRIPGSGTCSLGVALNNSGLIDLQGSASLGLSNGGTNTGQINVPAGSLINFGGGNFISTTGSSIQGQGSLLVTSGIHTFAGTVALGSSNVFTGGTGEFSGNYSCINNVLTIAGGTASFDGTGTVSPFMVNLSTGTLGGAQDVFVSSVMNWTGGTMAGSGRTRILSSATLSMANTNLPIFINARTLDNAGTANWTGKNLTMTGGSISNETGATFQIVGPQSISSSGGNPHFDNLGILQVNGSGTVSLSGIAFNNFNLVNLQGTTFTLSGGGTNTGSITVPSDAGISFGGFNNFVSSVGSIIAGAGVLTVTSGNQTFAGTVMLGGSNLFSGGITEFTGTYVATNNLLAISGGSPSFDGTGTISPSILNLSLGTLKGSQDVTVMGAMIWTGGGMAGSGRTKILPSATMVITNLSAGISITGRILDNAGLAIWNGGSSMTLTGGAITNEPGAVFQIQSPRTIGFGGGSPRFDNNGTLRITGGGTTAFNGVPLNNYGTADIQSGILSAAGGYFSFSDSTLSYWLGGKSAGTNYGQLLVQNSVALSGNLSVKFTNSFVPAANDSFTLVSAGSRSGSFSNFLYPSNQFSMILSNTPVSVVVVVTNVHIGPIQPSLNLGISATSLQISWPTNFPNYHLENESSLGGSTWSAASNNPIVLGTNFVITIPFSSSSMFYRLSSIPTQ